MTTSNEIVAIIGSPRRNGNTSVLAEAALRELELRGYHCKRIVLSDLSIAACDGHSDCSSRRACAHADDAPAALEEVYSAGGLILASPVYYHNVSSQMKTFMDRHAFLYYHDHWLKATVAGLIAVARDAGLEATLDAMRRFLELSSRHCPSFLTLGGHADVPGEIRENEILMEQARELGRAMSEKMSEDVGGCAEGQ